MKCILLFTDVFLSGIKIVLESGNLTNEQYKDIGLAVWSVSCNKQKAQLQLRHWGIDKYFKKSSDFVICDDETLYIINCVYQTLKS